MGSRGTLLLKKSSTLSDTRPRDIFRDGNLANDQRCLTQTKRQDLFISLCHLTIAISRTCRYMRTDIEIFFFMIFILRLK